MPRGWLKSPREIWRLSRRLHELDFDATIDFIHLLKVDTQGFEFEVFQGAERLMNENKIALLYFEFNFSDMYKGLPSFHTVHDFLLRHNFSLVTIYQLFYQKKPVSWTDMQFINSNFYRQRAEQDPTW